VRRVKENGASQPVNAAKEKSGGKTFVFWGWEKKEKDPNVMTRMQGSSQRTGGGEKDVGKKKKGSQERGKRRARPRMTIVP